MLRIKEVRMDYEKKLMAVTQIPQFSWVIESDRPATLQTGYQLQISRADDFGDLVYDSGQKTVRYTDRTEGGYSGAKLLP